MRSGRDRVTAIIMLTPSIILLAIFVYGFIFQTISSSATDWGEASQQEQLQNPRKSPLSDNLDLDWVGLENYRFLMQDPGEFDFRTGLVNTFFFTILFVAGSLVLGFTLALLLDMRVILEGVFRTIFLFPMALSLVVVGTIWRWLLQPEGINALPNSLFGLDAIEFNWLTSREQVLTFPWEDGPMYLTYIGLFILGLMAFNFFVNRRWRAGGWAIGIGGVLIFLLLVGFWENTLWPPRGIRLDTGEFFPVDPATSPEPKGFQLALTGIIIAAVWQMSGYVMAMFLAGIRGIPEELREAGRVDGCTEIGVYWRIVLPQLRPVALSAVIILGHISLKIFDLVFAMTGRENFQTMVPGIQVYGSFATNRFASASAIAVIMLALVSVVIVPYLWSQLRERNN